ncbi:uncharacterized protein LOC128891569 [Hylaeus anthracinus]|uniref:uncharacterized protein LOC128881455 n=1 Tax=Hylaeus volcanicus TaxID=313075 RepID=UPI0023B86908|nr:uncharacterized protein LOC128881455 [Hylaeus volcanicus]XP_054007134.1 uncharacterized protein LOC128891569 [Hylaeus anthracinus]
MDGSQSHTAEVTQDVADSSLPAVVASLEMLTVNSNLSTSENKRWIRRKISVPDSNESLNRRCSLRPRKRTSIEMENDDKKRKTQGPKEEVKEYYLNKNLKRKLNNLETIYEEKDDLNESSMHMSIKRYKRVIQFQETPSDRKIKKRRAKIKKVFGSKVNFKGKCASMQMMLDKLNGIRVEPPAIIDGETK